MTVAEAQTDNSPTKSDFDSAWIEKGTVSDVDLKNWTVDVVSEYTGKVWPQLQVVTPYFHTNNGEGIFAMPEIGACCLVCLPSDDETPYILGFIGSFELENAQTANLDDKAGEVTNETEELTPPKSSTSPGGPEATSASASARAGRPYLNPGDIMIRTRDQNFLVLRRGGVVQIGATPTCQTIYVPILNHLRQFAENFETSTPGGLLTWSVDRVESDPGGEAPCLYRLSLRDKAQNEKADVQIRMGHVDDSVRYELEVAPVGVSVNDGKVTGSKAKITVDVSGNQSVTLSGSMTQTISQNKTVVVQGNESVQVSGSQAVKAASQAVEISGTHSLKATTSTENISGLKTISAALVSIGKVPVPTVIGPALVAWLAAHTHAASFTPPNEVGTLPAVLSKTVLVSG